MSTMTSQSARARAGATPGFEQLCKALYGDAVDAQAVWEEVIKASPDQADLHAKTASSTKRKILEGVALTSTAAGGVLGVKEGIHAVRGLRAANRLVKTGETGAGTLRRKALISAGLAGAATGGDVITGAVLSTGKKKEGETTSKRLVPVAKLAPMPGIPKAVSAAATGLRRMWNPASVPTTGIPKAARAVAGGTHRAPAASAAAAGHPALPGLGHVALPSAKAQAQQAVGADISRALHTRTGKVMAGGLATVGAVGATKAVRRYSAGVDSAPDDYYKRDDSLDVEFSGTFSKLDEDKRTAFGWASVTKVNGSPVVDKQGDYIDLEDLEKAAYDYVVKCRVGGDMHKRADLFSEPGAHKVSDMIESIVFTPDKIEKLGLPQDFPQGWWVGYKIHDDDTWDLVKKGERTGFSIHGRGMRKAADMDEIMGYR